MVFRSDVIDKQYKCFGEGDNSCLTRPNACFISESISYGNVPLATRATPRKPTLRERLEALAILLAFAIALAGLMAYFMITSADHDGYSKADEVISRPIFSQP